MTTAHFYHTPYATLDAVTGLGAATPERAPTRVWRFLVDAGQRRAANELARYVRLHGGRPTGNVAQDARQLAALRLRPLSHPLLGSGHRTARAIACPLSRTQVAGVARGHRSTWS